MSQITGDSKMFWGIVFVVLGLVVILNAAFGFNLPIMRTLFGVVLIYFGFKMLFGPIWSGSWNKNHKPQAGKIVLQTAVTKPGSLKELDDNSFNVVLGRGELDLTQTKIGANEHLEINTVLSEVRVLLPKDLEIEPSVSSVAGHVNLPAAAESGDRTLKLRIDTVLGTTKFERK